MNAHPDIDSDFGALAREYWLSLGPADRIRWLDERLLELGPTAPIAEFEDIKADAENWAAMCLDDVLAIYLGAIVRVASGKRLEKAAAAGLVELWRSLPEPRQAAALKFFEESGK